METASYQIEGGDYERGGAASKDLKEILKRLGVDPRAVRRTMVAAYEAEMNVVIHAQRGVMKVAVDPEQVDVAIIDEGPGIEDIALALSEGYSTAPATARELGFGAGMGLPNIRRNTDRFSLQSVAGKGSQIRFTVFLQPQPAAAAAPNSVHADAELCVKCLKCLHSCPTQAIRIREGGPRVLERVCIDCAVCTGVCKSHALRIDLPETLPHVTTDSLLVFPVALFEQFGPGTNPADVFAALEEIGLSRIRLDVEWERALRTTVLEYATAERRHPVLSPVCPAVVNLIQVRFPSLLGQLAPFLSPPEAAREELMAEHVVHVPLCPSQRSVFQARTVLNRLEVASPADLRRALLPAVLARRHASAPWTAPMPAEPQDPRVLHVSGIRHVLRVLDEIENGAMSEYAVIELFACDQGHFGSPVWTQDPFVSRPGYERKAQFVDELLAARYSGHSVAGAVRRTVPVPARPGLRLHEDMHVAIERLARMDILTKSLPGRNCGVCGAPTCAALAEDTVLGLAHETDCAYLDKE